MREFIKRLKCFFGFHFYTLYNGEHAPICLRCDKPRRDDSPAPGPGTHRAHLGAAGIHFGGHCGG
jgi:hypothetical protein